MNVRHTLTAAALFLLTGAAAWAQAGAQQPPQPQRPPQQQAEGATRVAILNVRGAIVSTAEGKQASAELQSQFAPRTNELENLRKQVQDLQKRLADGERTLSDDEKNRLARQIDSLSRQFQRKQESLQEDLNEAQNEVIERIGQKMMDVLDRYVRENGIGVVLDVSAQTTPVVYASPTINITQDVVRLYDQANPVRSQPAQPQRPPAQPGQTRPPQQ